MLDTLINLPVYVINVNGTLDQFKSFNHKEEIRYYSTGFSVTFLHKPLKVQKVTKGCNSDIKIASYVVSTPKGRP